MKRQIYSYVAIAAIAAFLIGFLIAGSVMTGKATSDEGFFKSLFQKVSTEDQKIEDKPMDEKIAEEYREYYSGVEKVDLKELLEGVKKTKKVSKKMRGDKYNEADANGDGILGTEDLELLLEKGGSPKDSGSSLSPGFQIGDADNSGYINSNDALIIMQRFVSGSSYYSPLELCYYDVDLSGYVNANDALMAQKIFINLENSPGTCPFIDVSDYIIESTIGNATYINTNVSLNASSDGYGNVDAYLANYIYQGFSGAVGVVEFQTEALARQYYEEVSGEMESYYGGDMEVISIPITSTTIFNHPNSFIYGTGTSYGTDSYHWISGKKVVYVFDLPKEVAEAYNYKHNTDSFGLERFIGKNLIETTLSNLSYIEQPEPFSSIGFYSSTIQNSLGTYYYTGRYSPGTTSINQMVTANSLIFNNPQLADQYISLLTSLPLGYTEVNLPNGDLVYLNIGGYLWKSGRRVLNVYAPASSLSNSRLQIAEAYEQKHPSDLGQTSSSSYQIGEEEQEVPLQNLPPGTSTITCKCDNGDYCTKKVGGKNYWPANCADCCSAFDKGVSSD